MIVLRNSCGMVGNQYNWIFNALYMQTAGYVELLRYIKFFTATVALVLISILVVSTFQTWFRSKTKSILKNAIMWMFVGWMLSVLFIIVSEVVIVTTNPDANVRIVFVQLRELSFSVGSIVLATILIVADRGRL